MSDDEQGKPPFDWEKMLRDMQQQMKASDEPQQEGEPGVSPDHRLAPDIEAIRLQDALRTLQKKYSFKVGMIVRQKQGVRAYRKHSESDLSIVVDLLSTPVLFEAEGEAGGSASPYFRQPLDMIVGHIDDDSFLLYHVDSRRFEPVPEEETRLRVRGTTTGKQ